MQDQWEIRPESQASFDRMRQRFADSVRASSESKGTVARPHCCFIQEDQPILLADGWEIDDVPCSAPAEWTIVHGPAPEDYTEACTVHVGALLTDAPEHRIYPLPHASAAVEAGQ